MFTNGSTAIECGGASSLGGDPLDDEYATLLRVLPERFDRLISGRIIPATCLFQAVEGDNHDVALGGLALDGLDLVTNNQISAAERGDCFRRFLSVSLRGSGILCFGGVLFNFSNDVGRGPVSLAAHESLGRRQCRLRTQRVPPTSS
jgi:hypothetical protein